MQRGSTWFFIFEPAPRVFKMPKRRKTSEQVTKMEMMIRTMMMYVSPGVERVSACDSVRGMMMQGSEEREEVDPLT